MYMIRNIVAAFSCNFKCVCNAKYYSVHTILCSSKYLVHTRSEYAIVPKIKLRYNAIFKLSFT